MKETERWLLPEGIDELLPEQAEQIEFLRRSILKLYQRWGYRFVMTPMVEHLDSLLVGMGNDLDKRTFKLTDQMTGRLLGVRADITPQVSRIDAHRLHQDGPSRLCYAGDVLLTRPRELGGSRNPIQIGAELYGHQGIESDIEVLQLMLSSLKKTKLEINSLDLGHVGIFRELIKQFNIDAPLEAKLFNALQRKAKTDIQDLLSSESVACQNIFDALIALNGGDEVFAEAKFRLSGANQSVMDALAELENIYNGLKKRCPNVPVHFDLAELRGYEYHTGLVFAAYVPDYWQAIAQGGRYDEVGKVFGRARSATGYSMDLRAVCELLPPYESAVDNIFAPTTDDADLEKKIHELRESGESVIRELPGQVGSARDSNCDRVLMKDNGQWQVQSI